MESELGLQGEEAEQMPGEHFIWDTDNHLPQNQWLKLSLRTPVTWWAIGLVIYHAWKRSKSTQASMAMEIPNLSLAFPTCPESEQI